VPARLVPTLVDSTRQLAANKPKIRLNTVDGKMIVMLSINRKLDSVQTEFETTPHLESIHRLLAI